MTLCILRRRVVRGGLELAILLAAAVSSMATFRNIDPPHAAAGTPAAGWSSAELIRTNGQRAAVGKSRAFHRQTVRAGETLRVALPRPDLADGERVFVYTINGGRVNGAIATNVPVANGRLEFEFKAGGFFGNQPVVLRHCGKEAAIEFWVDADAPTKAGKDGP